MNTFQIPSSLSGQLKAYANDIEYLAAQIESLQLVVEGGKVHAHRAKVTCRGCAYESTIYYQKAQYKTGLLVGHTCHNARCRKVFSDQELGKRVKDEEYVEGIERPLWQRLTKKGNWEEVF